MTGAIAAGQYYVAPAVPVTVQLHDQSLNRTSIKNSATASYTINSNNNVVGVPGGILEAWLTGTGASSSNYEVMATQSSGATIAGSVLGSWLNCNTSPVWSITNSARDNSVITGVIAVQIRDVATHTVQASASITLSAESDSGL